jgi:HAD superfamily hydrolase (TIGR01509 family)
MAHVILIGVTENAHPKLGLLFDMDGVLVHSMPLHTLAWERYLEGLSITVDDLERRMHGKRNSELVNDLINSELTEDIVFGHGAAKEKLFREMMAEEGFSKYEIPGLAEFLERYKHFPKAIGTNAEQANIDFVMDNFGLRQYFQVSVNGEQVERPKPFPDIYLKAAKLLKMDPKDCIVFEDSPTGAQAGRAAGMRVVGVETTPTRFEDVDLCIKDFLDPKLEAWMARQV